MDISHQSTHALSVVHFNFSLSLMNCSCPYYNENTSLRNLLDLFVAAKHYQVESLFRTLQRRLSVSIVTKASAIAVHAVSQSIDAQELAQYCSAFLLMCTKDLSQDELLRTLVPKQ